MVAAPGKIRHSVAAEAVVALADLWQPFAPCGHFLNPVGFVLRVGLGDRVVDEEAHFADQVLGTEVVDLGSLDLAEAAVHETSVHLYNPDLAALAILNDSVVAVHLCLVVAGSEYHTDDPARQLRGTVHWHTHPLHNHAHWVAAHLLLCLVAVGLVGHIVDPASYRLLDVRPRKPRSVSHIHFAAADGRLACSLAVHNPDENSPGHTARVHSRYPHHCLCNSGHAAGSNHIHNRRIHRVAGRSDRSPDHKTGHSCHIAAAEDSRHSVFAPEPAGAGRSMLDEELGRSWTDRTPCCQSIGCESGEVACMLQKCTRRRAAFNGARGVYGQEADSGMDDLYGGNMNEVAPVLLNSMGVFPASQVSALV